MGGFNFPYLPDTQDLSGQFNTPLSKEEERAFLKWAGDRVGDLRDYDLKGAWKAGFRSKGHLPDTFKKPNHPTFSEESMYSQPGMAGGSWGDKTFSPSQTNLRTYPAGDLQAYLDEVEPGYRLSGNLVPKISPR